MNTTFLDVMFFVSVELCAEGKKFLNKYFRCERARLFAMCELARRLGSKVSDNGHKASYTDGVSVWLLYGIVRNNRPWHYTEYLMGN